MDTEDTNPSEKRYGITKQPPPTCDIINKVISEVEDCQRELRGYEKAEEEELRDMLSRIESNLCSLVGYRKEGHLEDIRRNAEAIRGWGQEWKDLAKLHAPEDEEYILSNASDHGPLPVKQDSQSTGSVRG